MTKITLLGAGAMGSRIAQNFINAGHEVTVYNRSPEKLAALKEAGAKIASTPLEAVNGASIVFSMVRDDEASKEVWLGENGAKDGLSSNSVAIEMSTLTAEWIKALAAEVEQTGAQFLEAPVLGTRPQAEAAQLIYLIGGSENTLEKVRDVLESTSGAIQHIGEFGQAATMKLSVNAQYGVQVAILAETLAILEKQGIDKEQAVEVISSLPTTSPAMAVAGSLIAGKKYAPMFPIDLVEKDFGYAEEIAENLGIDTPTIKAVRSLYAKAKDQGFGGDNIVGVAQLMP